MTKAKAKSLSKVAVAPKQLPMHNFLNVPFFFDKRQTAASVMSYELVDAEANIAMRRVTVDVLGVSPDQFTKEQASSFAARGEGRTYISRDGSVFFTQSVNLSASELGLVKKKATDYVARLIETVDSTQDWTVLIGNARDALAHVAHTDRNLVDYKSLNVEMEFPVQRSLLIASCSLADALFQAGIITAKARDFHVKHAQSLMDRYHMQHKGKALLTIIREYTDQARNQVDHEAFVDELIEAADDGFLKRKPTKNVRTVGKKPKAVTPAKATKVAVKKQAAAQAPAILK